jgi:hypothetical protein
MHGELDRAMMLAVRAAPARDPARSSLPRLVAAPAAATRPSASDLAASGVPGPLTGDITIPVLGDLGAALLGDVPAPVTFETITAELTAPVRAPTGAAELTAWGKRLLNLLFSRALIELGGGPGIDEISYQIGGLLHAHGDEAVEALDTAEWLANELAAIRGVARLFATPSDLQLALRRSRTAE